MPIDRSPPRQTTNPTMDANFNSQHSPSNANVKENEDNRPDHWSSEPDLSAVISREKFSSLKFLLVESLCLVDYIAWTITSEYFLYECLIFKSYLQI